MPDAPRINVDVYERHSRMPERLRQLGGSVEVQPLAAGDYRFEDGAVVERKQVLDLHSSLQQGRLWRQLGALRSATRKPYLLVEGRSLDDGPLSRNAIRGVCVAALDMGVRLIQSRDADDSARWLYRLAVRAARSESRVRPSYAQRPKPLPESVPEAMLATVGGISVVAARALLREFGSVTKLLEASPTEWQRVEGIGPRRATALAEAVTRADVTTHSLPSGRSRVSRERQGRAT